MGKADKNKSNNITSQWAIPTVLLMLFLVFTLIDYNTTMQENARMAEEERQGKIRSALLKARMTVKAKHEDRVNARDKRHLENYMDEQIIYILECYDAAALLISDAELSILEVAEALKEYQVRFGSSEEA